MKRTLWLVATMAALAGLPAAAGATVPDAGPCTPGAAYDPACDVDHDGDVDVLDIQLAAGHWNQSGAFTSGGWDLTGNAGTTPASNFLGTTDSAALELRVNSWRVLRLEPNGPRPNVIGGSSSNSALSGVESGTVAGGGSDSLPNRVTDSYGFVGGGYGNTAGDNAGTASDRSFATVAGGGGNSASGFHSTVSGGWYNVASGDTATVGGGQVNESSGVYTTVGGGYSNVANGNYGTVGGGNDNQAAGQHGFVGGGEDNWASGHAVVAGGQNNTANPFGTVPGGVSNFAGGDYSFAAGRRAKAYFDGDFVWADSADADFGATATNQFLVRASGGVGLGTNSPGNQLHVAESINADASPANHVAQIQNTSTGNSADVLALKIGYTGNPLDSNNYITFFKGNDASAGAIEGNGSGGVVLSGPGNEIALWLPKLDAGEEMAPGDLVGVVDGKATRDTARATQVFVVASGSLLAGNDPGQQARAGYVPVTVLGLAAVRVAGPVHEGDAIVPSGRSDGAGVATTLAGLPPEQMGLLAGQAWTTDDAPGVRLVPVAVGIGGLDSWQLLSLLSQQSVRIAELEARLAALESPPTGP